MMPGLKIAWEVEPELRMGDWVSYDEFPSMMRSFQIYRANDGSYIYMGENPVIETHGYHTVVKNATWSNYLQAGWSRDSMPRHELDSPIGGLALEQKIFPMTFLGHIRVREPLEASLWEVDMGGDHRITITYAIITPEFAAEGDFADTGWYDQEGRNMNADETGSAVERAVHYLRDQGVSEASSWPFSTGTWYSRITDDFYTGNQTEYSYHLEGFTEDEEEEIYERLCIMSPQRLRVAHDSAGEELEHYHRHDTDLSFEQLNKAEMHSIGEIGDVAVMVVNGQWIRDNVDIDFTSGGNPARYEFVPEHEIWLEYIMEPRDFAACALHEYVEYKAMQDDGLDYDKGHEKASRCEQEFRDAGLKIESLDDVVPAVTKWLQRSKLAAKWEEIQEFHLGQDVKVMVPLRILKREVKRWGYSQVDYEQIMHVIQTTPAEVSEVELGNDDRLRYFVTWPALDAWETERGSLGAEGFWFKLEQLSAI